MIFPAAYVFVLLIGLYSEHDKYLLKTAKEKMENTEECTSASQVNNKETEDVVD